MHLYDSLADLPPFARGGSIAIGNFDGLHLGHQAILSEARQDAERSGGKAGLLSFEPHPRHYFNPQAEPFRLTLLRDKVRFLEHAGWELLFALPFNRAMAETSPGDFVEILLHEKLQAKSIFIGADFHFGASRQGTPDLLKKLAGEFGIKVQIIPQLKDRAGIPFSSTFIREALKAGDMKGAKSQLGRDWSISGIVFQGDQRGRQLGFPTANLSLDGYLVPALGVYAISAEFAGKICHGVANIGKRPTIGSERIQLEAHLFDFQGDLYGQELVIHLIDFIRPEQKFANLTELKTQIALDSERARTLLQSM